MEDNIASLRESICGLMASGDMTTSGSVYYHIKVDLESRTELYLIDLMRSCFAELSARIYRDEFGEGDNTPECKQRWLEILEELATAHFRTHISEDLKEWSEREN